VSADDPMLAAFLAAAVASTRPGDDALLTLGERLESSLRAAREAWPDVALSPEAFASCLGTHVGDEGSLLEALDALRAPDLYLACACARGDERALRAFESSYFREIDAALGRIRTRATLDEAKQLVRDRLFVGADGAPPRIAQYSGRGDLRNWFRVAVVRMLLNVATRAPKERPLDDGALEAIPAASPDPELDLLRRRYRREFKEAFDESVAALGERERVLLRYAFCDALTVEEIGALYGVHRATAARWVQKARTELFERVQTALRTRLRLTTTEIESVVRLIGSNLDWTISQQLRVEE
jgi:RNA polymerase sigma-70 factor (ECF subfamily)